MPNWNGSGISVEYLWKLFPSQHDTGWRTLPPNFLTKQEREDHGNIGNIKLKYIKIHPLKVPYPQQYLMQCVDIDLPS